MHSLCLILVDRIQLVRPTYIRREGYLTTSQWKSDKELAVLVCSCGSRQAQLRCLHSAPFPTAIFAISPSLSHGGNLHIQKLYFFQYFMAPA